MHHRGLSRKTYRHCRYNTSTHPIAFHKATDLGKIPQKISGPAAPDLEEAYDVRDQALILVHRSNCLFQVDEEEEETPDPKKVVDEDDVSQDSLIKAPKRGGGDTKAKGKAAGKAKAR